MHSHQDHDPIVRSYKAQDELDISNTTWHRWAKAGRFKLVKIGPRASGIRRSELDRLKNGDQSRAA